MTAQIDRRRFLRIMGVGAAGLALGVSAAGAQWSREPEYVFAAIADPHLRENREGEPTGVAKFRAALERVNEVAPACVFALLLGDIHPERLEPLLPDIALPLHAVAGNHESVNHRKMLREMFPDDFGGRDFYSFQRGGDLFIALCTAIPGDHVGHLQSQFIEPPVQQCAWLEELLAQRSDFRHVFLFGHVPPEAQNRPSTMCLAQNDSRWLQGIVTESRPTALFFGHRHRQIDFTIEGVPVFGVRSCNWNSGGETIGFLLVAVFSDGIETRFVPTVME